MIFEEKLITDDGITIAESKAGDFVIRTKPFENERLGDYFELYTSYDNCLLKIRAVIVDVVYLTDGDVEVVGLICKKGNRVVKYD